MRKSARRTAIQVVLALAAMVTVAGSTSAGAEVVATTTVVESGVVNRSIPTTGTSGPVTPSPTLTVADAGRVADVRVGVRIDHTSVADLDIYLKSPDGTSVELTTGNGGASAADLGTAAECASPAGLTVFDDAATSSIIAGAAPFVGSFAPETSLTALETESSAGTWTLEITDGADPDVGQLVCWTLMIDIAGPLEALRPCDQVAWSGADSFTDQIYTANADGTGRALLSTAGPDPDPELNTDPAWSPDGTRIAWSGNLGAGIYVADADGTNRTEISTIGPDPDPTLAFEPVWSPDGTRIAWQGSDGATSQIYTADADGSARIVLSAIGSDPDPDFNSGPAWSPDGTRIAWSGGLDAAIYVADADGTDRLVVSTVDVDPDPTSNASPAWSPDGSRLAWAGSDGATSQIYVADVDGTDRLVVSTVDVDPDPTFNRTPAWSPDGSRLAWAGLDEATFQIYVADVDGTDRTVVSTVDVDPDPTFNIGPVWSPDGTRIGWEAGVIDNHVYVADADGTNRAEISTVELGLDPTGNGRVAWRNQPSDLSVTTTHSGLAIGETATLTATVANDGPCSSIDVAVAGLSVPCIETPDVSASAGSVTGSTWTIGALAAGTSATLAITGMVAADDCSSTLTTTAVPALAAPLATVMGDTAATAAGPASCPSAVAPFTDVVAGSFAAGDVDCLYGLGIVAGTTGTTYSPGENVTREQMAAFLARLYRALGKSCPSAVAPFTDVVAGSFAAGDVDCLYGLGIVAGTTGTTYSPGENVTREQMAAFLARLYRVAINEPV